MNRLLPVALRGSGAVLRLLLLVAIGALLTVGDVADYGLMFAAVALALQVLGLDFYTFSTRELVSASPEVRGGYLRSHLALFGVTHALSTSGVGCLIIAGLLSTRTGLVFLMILVVEHACQELDRFMVACQRQVVAALLYFLRSGAWVIVVGAVWVVVPGSRQLGVAYAAWALCAGIAAAAGLRLIVRSGMSPRGHEVDWAWLRRGVRISVWFLVGTVALKGISTFDRFILDDVASDSVVGSYVFYATLGNGVILVLSAGTHMFAYPDLVRHYRNHDERLFTRTLRGVAVQTGLIVTAYSVVLLAAVYSGLPSLISEDFEREAWIAKWAMLASSLFAFGIVPQLALYAQSRDTVIVLSRLAGLGVFLTIGATSYRGSGSLAVMVGAISGFAVILLWQGVAFIARPRSPEMAADLRSRGGHLEASTRQSEKD